MGIFGVTAAPLVEELFFRGFLYPVLARRLGTSSGVIVTALAFALIHQSQLAYSWGPLLLLFLVGLVITVIRAFTQSVAAGFLVHVAYNSTLFVTLWIGTDHFRHLERIT
jgi:membrane protease YdiL (CAAX protease family)